jgi:hypothetical protein
MKNGANDSFLGHVREEERHLLITGQYLLITDKRVLIFRASYYTFLFWESLWKKEKITENKRKGREGKGRKGKGRERKEHIV